MRPSETFVHPVDLAVAQSDWPGIIATVFCAAMAVLSIYGVMLAVEVGPPVPPEPPAPVVTHDTCDRWEWGVAFDCTWAEQFRSI